MDEARSKSSQAESMLADSLVSCSMEATVEILVIAKSKSFTLSVLHGAKLGQFNIGDGNVLACNILEDFDHICFDYLTVKPLREWDYDELLNPMLG